MKCVSKKNVFVLFLLLVFTGVSGSESVSALTENKDIFKNQELTKSLRVDQGCQLSAYENYYRQWRNHTVIKDNTLKFLESNGHDTSKIDKQNYKQPNISFCFSGGGYRAMISCLGFMLAAQETNLINTAMNVATLSGSAWLMAPMMVRKLFPDQYKPILKKRVRFHMFELSRLGYNSIGKKLLDQLFSSRDVQFVDVWGALIADALMGDMGKDYAQEVSFKNVQDCLKESANYPFPIFTAAITPDKAISRKLIFDRNLKQMRRVVYTSKKKRKQWRYDYEWMEINPFNSGSDYLTGFVDTNEFGSPFSNGICKKVYPEMSLGSFMGLCGSAYSLSLGDVLRIITENVSVPFISSIIEFMMSSRNNLKQRFLPAEFNNFAYNLGGSPASYLDELILEDAGFAFNLPIPPLLRQKRDTNIIIACDASKGAYKPGYKELALAAAYAKRKNLKFPDITKPTKVSENFAIFEDEKDPTVPTVIYFSNSEEFSFDTLKLDYNDKEFEDLCGFMQKHVANHSKDIADVIAKRSGLVV